MPNNSTIFVPKFPAKLREKTAAEVVKLAKTLAEDREQLKEQPEIMDALKGTIPAKKWAIMAFYWLRLERARQLAVASPNVTLLEAPMIDALAKKAEHGMKYDDRIQLTKAIWEVIAMDKHDREVERLKAQHSGDCKGAPASRKAKLAARRERDRQRTLATAGHNPTPPKFGQKTR